MFADRLCCIADLSIGRTVSAQPGWTLQCAVCASNVGGLAHCIFWCSFSAMTSPSLLFIRSFLCSSATRWWLPFCICTPWCLPLDAYDAWFETATYREKMSASHIELVKSNWCKTMFNRILMLNLWFLPSWNRNKDVRGSCIRAQWCHACTPRRCESVWCHTLRTAEVCFHGLAKSAAVCLLDVCFTYLPCYNAGVRLLLLQLFLLWRRWCAMLAGCLLLLCLLVGMLCWCLGDA